jgi:hypothetical protein
MPDYKNSKIYKIVSPSNPEMVYYGSTTQKLSVRMAAHRCRPLKSSGLITCYEDSIILLVENFSCNNKEELIKKEGEYILNNDCVNKRVEGRTKREYYLDNEEKTKKYKKEYYNTNKDKIKQQNEENKHNIAEKRKKYREQNTDLIKEQNKKYNLKRIEYLKKYRELNREKINENKRRYRNKIKNENKK